MKQDGDSSIFIYTAPFHNNDINYYLRYACQTWYGCKYIFVKITTTKISATIDNFVFMSDNIQIVGIYMNENDAEKYNKFCNLVAGFYTQCDN